MTFLQAFAAERQPKRTRTRTPMLVSLGRFAGRHLPRWQTVRSLVLQVGGLGSLDYAAFQWNVIAGFVAAGVSLLVLEYLMGGDS